VENNPVNYIDPYGQIAIVVPVIPVLPQVIIGIGGVIATYIWWLQNREAIEQELAKCIPRTIPRTGTKTKEEKDREERCKKAFNQDIKWCLIAPPARREECYHDAVINYQDCIQGREPSVDIWKKYFPPKYP
jgi:hypothetical protein